MKESSSAVKWFLGKSNQSKRVSKRLPKKKKTTTIKERERKRRKTVSSGLPFLVNSKNDSKTVGTVRVNSKMWKILDNGR